MLNVNWYDNCFYKSCLVLYILCGYVILFELFNFLCDYVMKIEISLG